MDGHIKHRILYTAQIKTKKNIIFFMGFHCKENSLFFSRSLQLTDKVINLIIYFSC